MCGPAPKEEAIMIYTSSLTHATSSLQIHSILKLFFKLKFEIRSSIKVSKPSYMPTCATQLSLKP